MTDQEKQRISVLRSQGESYKAISETLKISINSVKTFCRRGHLTGIRREKDLKKPSEKINLIDDENRGNTVTAEASEVIKNPDYSTSRKAYKVKLVFAETPDETAIPDVLEMLINSRLRRW